MGYYFDNAATTPLLPEVKQVMHEIIDNSYGNPSSIHRLGREAKTIVERARKTVANTIISSVGEVFFTSGATESNNLILFKAFQSLRVRRIISSPIEHHCVLHSLEELEKLGCEVILLNVDNEGNIDLDQLRDVLSQSAKKTLVSLMHGNNEIGNLIDLTTIGTLCKEFGALFHTDTAQTIGKLPIDVEASSIDFLTGSAHKFHGPKGIGFVYIKGDHKLDPLLIGGSQERNMRSGTENVICIAGMAEALQQSIDNRELWQAHIKNLRKQLKEGLKETIPDIVFNGNQEYYLNHVLSTGFPKSKNSDLMEVNLDMKNIYASAGSACSSGTLKASHVMQAIGADPNRKPVRFSFSAMNTTEEVDSMLSLIGSICHG